MIRNFLLLYFCFINLCQASDFKTIQQQRQEMENAFAKVSIEFEEYFDKKDFYQEFFNL